MIGTLRSNVQPFRIVCWSPGLSTVRGWQARRDPQDRSEWADLRITFVSNRATANWLSRTAPQGSGGCSPPGHLRSLREPLIARVFVDAAVELLHHALAPLDRRRCILKDVADHGKNSSKV